MKCIDCNKYEGLTRDLPYCGNCAVKHYGLKPNDKVVK